LNYFAVFGLSDQFDLDTDKLAELFQALQKAVHPDRFAHTSSQQQLLAVQKSAMINDAYQTLKNPLKRAEHLLKVRAVELPSEQASFGDTRFLMRQMELREMLDEVTDAADSDAALLAINEVIDGEYDKLFTDLQQRLAINTEQSNNVACDDLRKLKFYQKLHVEVDRLEEKLFDA
jgi:molecular chaperone HscB